MFELSNELFDLQLVNQFVLFMSRNPNSINICYRFTSYRIIYLLRNCVAIGVIERLLIKQKTSIKKAVICLFVSSIPSLTFIHCISYEASHQILIIMINIFQSIENMLLLLSNLSKLLVFSDTMISLYKRKLYFLAWKNCFVRIFSPCVLFHQCQFDPSKKATTTHLFSLKNVSSPKPARHYYRFVIASIDNIIEISKCNFSGRRYKIPITREWVEGEIAKYDHEDGVRLHGYVMEHHEASKVVNEVLNIVVKAAIAMI